MKRKILAGIFGLGFTLSLINVNAEVIDSIDDSSTGGNVTVWSVDVPVYDVEIEWENMEYNWEYRNFDFDDPDKKEFGWTRNLCIPYEKAKEEDYHYYPLDSIAEEEYVEYISQFVAYVDTGCNNSLNSQNISYEDFVNNKDSYYYMPSIGGGNYKSSVTIRDNSVVYSVNPSIEWTSSENYDWTYADFSYGIEECQKIEAQNILDRHIANGDTFYTDSSCSTILEDETPNLDEATPIYAFGINYQGLEGSEIPEEGRINNTYNIEFDLKIDNTKEIITPKEGDVIGIVTVSIK